MLQLIRHVIGRKIFEQETTALRAAVHSLSMAADAQALVAAFDKVKQGNGDCPSADAMDEARAGLVLDDESVREMSTSSAHLPPVIAELASVRARVTDWPLSGDAWRLVGAGLKETYRRGRRDLLGERGPCADDADWNQLRKRTRDLAHQLYVLQPI